MSTCSCSTAAEEDLLGRVRDRPPHAAGRAVARSRQDPTVPAGPRLVERVGEQRERAGLAFDVGQHRVDQTGLESKPRRAGGTLDRPAKLVDLHRPEQVLVLGQRGGEARMLGAASVEVRAEGDHDRRGARLAQVQQASMKRARLASSGQSVNTSSS